MAGSLDMRKFLWQSDEPLSSTPQVPAPRNGELPRVSEEQVHRARVAVAAGATGAEDCRLLLDMLGLTPGEDGVPPVRR
ncbi:hypothetical protein C1701_12385 [Actinoalloteichus sp. AHMU CJ021]|uniref:Uncharacterized protein n=1 Tax=Actinoalloteichus caeruleus DSM 43889 TaxID=1120930 RepID=A0ABT1JM94_ACTCY|nr:MULTISPECIES: hypothetical protein [Actinoalloteichus]AUS79022.1 hypothetical protein C1701_12385 [Actinoalloteichus sp. AHMU CJ021]MCP2333256.1 hypothetical protein [Actinoalloteichus caeruleus DSM 43889]